MSIHPEAPKRAVVGCTISFGLVHVPMKVYSGVEDTKLVEKHRYLKGTDHQIGNSNYDKTTNKTVTSDQIVECVDVDGKLVEISDDDIALATSGLGVDRGGIAIEALVPLDSLSSRYVVQKVYQVRAGDKADKPFALLMAALNELQVGALIRVGIRSYPRYGVITGDGVLHMLFFDEEVREPRPMPSTDVDEKELTMATTLLTALFDHDTPVLANECKAAVAAFVADKAKGETPTIELVEAPKGTVDLSAALEASLAAMQKAA